LRQICASHPQSLPTDVLAEVARATNLNRRPR